MEWLQEKVRTGQSLSEQQALAILQSPDDRLGEILDAATEARRQRFGDKVKLCSIVSAKSGLCGEDCIFCAQSSRHSTDVECFSLLSDDELLAAYTDAAALPVEKFGVVTSGRSLSDQELARLCELIKANAHGRLDWCASLGMLNEAQLARLKHAGLKMFHHNLETAESFFPNICTTHTYADRVDTVLAAKRVGLEVCSGGLFGLGEGPHHRVELAMALRELEVHAIPLNFLVAIPHTPAAEAAKPMTAHDILRTIAMFRLVCRQVELKVCAGREVHLGAMEDQIFAAGATGMMIGGYLTVRGRSVPEDISMLQRAGMVL